MIKLYFVLSILNTYLPKYVASSTLWYNFQSNAAAFSHRVFFWKYMKDALLHILMWAIFLLFPLFLFQLTPDYECVNFTLRQHLPVARMSPYIPLEIRDWYSPGMLILLWINQLSIIFLIFIYFYIFFVYRKTQYYIDISTPIEYNQRLRSMCKLRMSKLPTP